MPALSGYRDVGQEDSGVRQTSVSRSGSTRHAEHPGPRSERLANDSNLPPLQQEINKLRRLRHAAEIRCEREIGDLNDTLTQLMGELQPRLRRLKADHESASDNYTRELERAESWLEGKLAKVDADRIDKEREAREIHKTKMDALSSECQDEYEQVKASTNLAPAFVRILKGKLERFDRELVQETKFAHSAYELQLQKLASELKPRIDDLEAKIASTEADIRSAHKNNRDGKAAAREEAGNTIAEIDTELRPLEAEANRSAFSKGVRRIFARFVNEPNISSTPPRRSQPNTGPAPRPHSGATVSRRPAGSNRPAPAATSRPASRSEKRTTRNVVLTAGGLVLLGGAAYISLGGLGSSEGIEGGMTAKEALETVIDQQDIMQETLENSAVALPVGDQLYNMYNGTNFSNDPADDRAANDQTPENFSNVLNAIVVESLQTEDGVLETSDDARYTADFIPLNTKIADKAAAKMNLEYDPEGANDTETVFKLAAYIFNYGAAELSASENKEEYATNLTLFYEDMLEQKFGITNQGTVDRIIALSNEFEKGPGNSDMAAEMGLSTPTQ
ncbi:MAG TPA: hypothetical protein VK978_02240 [Candidatus Saccharimonadales bacterium]|nr:hypothetical protein [Candidatus Saccharimonadales bacterium]